ncbi:spermidine putrescine ABC transporter permease component PotB (plasmid) [Sinorhizobium americanum]|uniref:Spermidine putrescine ABC transporter permease component PotB n=1 Tax=Sinorhizobium americanum TaxID=194963 RepID=A0A1L3LTM4_9HYPH|nr:spermidine putrescine ABC transporter permease component PotB [Sinorhizobium americanum]
MKELRLRGIDTIEAANAYAPEFIADFNRRFGKVPRNPKDMHRPFVALCRKELRKLSQGLALRYDKVMFLLEPSDLARTLAGQKVIVCDYPDGRLEVTQDGTSLPYRTFDTLRSVHRSEVVENKRLDDMLAVVTEMQAGESNSAAREDRAAPARRTICSGFPTAAKAMAIRSVAASRVQGRISPTILW